MEIEAEADPVVDVADIVEVDEDEDEADADDDDIAVDEDEEEDVLEVVQPAPRPAARPSPGRPPSAREEPEPPFFVGERVALIKNTRPRTGTPIADHPVGAKGRIETVLSQTAIVRFDRAPDVKEVVAFVCLDSLDEEAKAKRAERDREAARQAGA